jgi:tetratricopeptide (TPR) repeat protein
LNALALAYSALTMWLRDQISSGNAQQAYTVIARQRRTLGALLDHCLRHQLFGAAESIRNALELYWLAAGLYEEADGWTGRIRQATGNPDGTPATAVSAATNLWLSAAGAQAGRQIMLRHFDAAEATFRSILEIRQAQPSTTASQEHIATTYHNLGVLSQGRRRLAEAARWFHQSLAVREPLDEPTRMSDTYFELGRNAQLEGRAQEADDWYRKSAEAKGAEDGPSAATRSHELGMAAHRAGRLDEADDLYSQSLAISIRFNDQRAMLAPYHQRGLLAQYRDQPDRAAGFYLQALAIAEKLGDQNNIATDFHQLGVLAQHREQLEEADDWFTKSLAIRNQLGDELGAATSYHHLGAVAQLRGQFDRAEEWYTKSLAIKEKVGAPLSLAPTLAHCMNRAVSTSVAALRAAVSRVRQV